MLYCIFISAVYIYVQNKIRSTNDTNYMYTLDMADRVDNNKKNRSVNWSERDRVILVQRVYEKEDESPRI